MTGGLVGVRGHPWTAQLRPRPILNDIEPEFEHPADELGGGHEVRCDGIAARVIEAPER